MQSYYAYQSLSLLDGELVMGNAGVFGGYDDHKLIVSGELIFIRDREDA